MEAPAKRMSAEEIGRRGLEIYEERIKGEVEAEHKGEIIAVNIFTGEYEIAPGTSEALKRGLAKDPDGLFYIGRIGFEYVDTLYQAVVIGPVPGA